MKAQKHPKLDSYLAELREAEDNHRKYASKWKHYQKVYLGENHPKVSKDDSDRKLYVKHAYQQIETIKVRLVEPDPDFYYEPVNPQHFEYAKAVAALQRYQFERDNILHKESLWAHDAMVLGLAVAKCVWALDEKRVMRTQRTLEGVKRVPALVKVKDDPTAIRVDPMDFFWDPAGTHIDDCRYVYHRVFLTKSALLKRVRDGIYEKDAVDRMITAKQKEASANENRVYSETDTESAQRRGDRFEVLERWDANGNKCVIGNRCEVLQEVECPYDHGQIPFVTTCTIPQPNSLVGISEVEAIESIQDYIWAVENLRVRSASMAIDPPFTYRRTMKGGSKFVIEPGGRIGVDSPSDIQQLQINPGSTFGMDEVQAALGYMQQMTGANSYLSGADSGMMGINQTTATGVNLIQQEANKRMAHKLMQMHIFYSRIAQFFVRLNQQFISQPRAVRITGTEQWVKVSPDEIAGDFEVRPKFASLSINREQQRQSAIELINTLTPLAGLPLPDGTTPNLSPAIDKLVESHDDVPERYHASIEDMRKAQEAMQPPPPPEPAPMPAPGGALPPDLDPALLQSLQEAVQGQGGV